MHHEHAYTISHNTVYKLHYEASPQQPFNGRKVPEPWCVPSEPEGHDEFYMSCQYPLPKKKANTFAPFRPSSLQPGQFVSI